MRICISNKFPIQLGLLGYCSSRDPALRTMFDERLETGGLLQANLDQFVVGTRRAGWSRILRLCEIE